MVRMQLVEPPRVVPDHDLRTQLPDQLDDGPHRLLGGDELAVRIAEEVDVPVAEDLGRRALLALATRCDFRRRDGYVVRPLRAVGSDNEVDGRPASRPLGRRTATAEAVVIRMGDEDQTGRRRRHLLDQVAVNHGNVQRRGPATRRAIRWMGRQQRH